MNEVSNLASARECMNAISSLLQGQMANIESAVATLDSAIAELRAATTGVEGLLNGFTAMDMDSTTIGEAVAIMEGLNASIGASEQTRQQAALMYEGVGNSLTATGTTLSGMNSRHSVLEEAHANTEHAATREAYMPV